MLARIFIIFLLFPFHVFAQEAELDDLLTQEEDKKEEAITQDQEPKTENLNIKKASNLDKLVPFSDIAVIQKRFLPRTGRFEFYPNVGFIINDAFFTNSLYGGRIAYSFTEQWGLELSALYFSNSEKQVVKDLRDNLDATTESLVIPKSYYGADIKWVPIYGKMAFSNRKIVPFDLYFSFGGGTMTTNQTAKPVAIHVGVGQSYGLTKGIALRWDTSFYWYNSDTDVSGGSSGHYMNMHLSLGASFFFPGATYR